jgi:hypothetical protein
MRAPRRLFRRERSALRRAGFFARLGFADLERLSVDVAAVETGDRRTPFVSIAVFDEAEALRLAARALGGDICRDELP